MLTFGEWYLPNAGGSVSIKCYKFITSLTVYWSLYDCFCLPEMHPATWPVINCCCRCQQDGNRETVWMSREKPIHCWNLTRLWVRRYMHTATHAAAAATRRETTSYCWMYIIYKLNTSFNARNTGLISFYCQMCVCLCVQYVGERNIPLASEGVVEEHVGYGLEHWEDQGGRSHVPTTRERKATKDLRGNILIHAQLTVTILVIWISWQYWSQMFSL